MTNHRWARRGASAALVAALAVIPARVAASSGMPPDASSGDAPVAATAQDSPSGNPESVAAALAPDSVETRVGLVARGLVLPVQVAGEEPVRHDLRDRMRHHRVPAVSVAVIEGERMAWARAWGAMDADGGTPVDAATLFQAASISKPIAALAALELADRGRLDLDAEVDGLLRGWRIARDPAFETGDVTLRRLLSHTAGLSVHGFRGYAAGEALPDLIDILDGRGRANSPPIAVEAEPGTEWRYSGGGYAVVQRLIEETTGRPFARVMRELLDELGMRGSTFAQPLPDSLSDRAASGHRTDGRPLGGGWHAYPVAAATGLWTTPSELARYMIAVGHWLAGEEGGVLSPGMTREMLAPGPNRWGLGPTTAGAGLDFRFEHTGSNEGYRSRFVYFPRRGIGAAIMTNGDGGEALAEEILYAIADEYDWPDIAPRRVRALPLSAGLAVEYTGRYRVPEAPDMGVTLEWRRGGLELRLAGRPPSGVVRVARDRFVIMSDGAPLRFERGPDGRVTAAIAYGTRAQRAPR